MVIPILDKAHEEAQEVDMSEDELIAADAARYLEVTRARIRALVRDGRLVGRVVASKVRVFSTAELDAYKAERDQRPKGGRPKKVAGPLMGARPA